jgi:putative nucleotidyltransferase with HDIG domain
MYIAGKGEKSAIVGEINALCPESCSRLIVPLIVKERAIGVLFIGSERESPFTPEDASILEKIAAQIGVALENARLLTDLEDLFLGTIRSLSAAIDAKSSWTSGHSDRVTEYAMKIGREMKLSEQDLKRLEYAGHLHDIGKIGIHEETLNKTEALTEAEWREVRKHPVKGGEILEPIGQLKDLIEIIKHHHEFYDGTGYPDGLAGEKIPLLARILSVADSVEAMKGARPYKEGRKMEEIVDEVKRCSGTQFDPLIVDAFIALYLKGKM